MIVKKRGPLADRRIWPNGSRMVQVEMALTKWRRRINKSCAGLINGL